MFEGLLATWTVTKPVNVARPRRASLWFAGRLRGEVVSGNYFTLLGVRALQGRLFTDDDNRQIPGRITFCGTENISTPNLSYAAQYLACALPCERFTSALTDNPCITRGRYGSLHLHRDGLPPSTFCRSPGAPVHAIKSGLGSPNSASSYSAAILC